LTSTACQNGLTSRNDHLNECRLLSLNRAVGQLCRVIYLCSVLRMYQRKPDGRLPTRYRRISHWMCRHFAATSPTSTAVANPTNHITTLSNTPITLATTHTITMTIRTTGFGTNQPTTVPRPVPTTSVPYNNHLPTTSSAETTPSPRNFTRPVPLA
jgi:hypothetical protein